MNQCTCGYSHGYDSKQIHGTRFISRYKGQNDYCVNGRRVGWNDDGTWRRDPNEQEKTAVLAWEKEFNS